MSGEQGASVRRIVSGAQTGVDRAALDVALELGIPCGGWVPRGRIDERGRIPDRYPNLRETATADWNERTEANVRDSDGTLLLSRGALNGGSAYTERMAAHLERPCLHVDLSGLPEEAAATAVHAWIVRESIEVLNVAGPRESKDPDLHERVIRVLRRALTGRKP